MYRRIVELTPNRGDSSWSRGSVPVSDSKSSSRKTRSRHHETPGVLRRVDVPAPPSGLRGPDLYLRKPSLQSLEASLASRRAKSTPEIFLAFSSREHLLDGLVQPVLGDGLRTRRVENRLEDVEVGADGGDHRDLTVELPLVDPGKHLVAGRSPSLAVSTAEASRNHAAHRWASIASSSTTSMRASTSTRSRVTVLRRNNDGLSRRATGGGSRR